MQEAVNKIDSRMRVICRLFPSRGMDSGTLVDFFITRNPMSGWSKHGALSHLRSCLGGLCHIEIQVSPGVAGREAGF